MTATLDPTDLFELTRRGLIAGAAAATLAGCGGDDLARTEAEATQRVRDAWWTTTIPTHPERIVADSVSTYAHLAALGVTPVGAAFPADISPAYIDDDAGDITNVVADDGWTISVEKALVERPDLIVAVGTDYNKENCERYRAAMATYCYVEGWTDAEEIKARFLELGTAIGREAEAKAAITEYDEHVADVRARVADAGLDGELVGVVRFDAAGFIGVRSGEAANAVLGSVGLVEPTWPKPGKSGYVELSLETLDVLNRADTLMVTTDDNVDIDQMDVFSHPLWLQLEPVVAGRAHFVGAWNGGDLIQFNTMLDDVETYLLGEGG